MTVKRYLFMDIFANILFLVLFYGILATPVLVFFIDVGVDVLFVVMAAVMCYFFVIRRVIKPVVPMFLAHVAVPVAAWYFAPGQHYVITYFIMTVMLTIFSLYQRHRKTLSFSYESTIFIPLSLVIAALIVIYFDHYYMIVPYAALIITISVGVRLHSRMYHINASLELISQNSTQPVQKILAFDYKILLVLTPVFVGLILLINHVIIRPILEAISGFRLNTQIDYTELPPFELLPGQSLPMAGGLPPELMGLDNEPSIIWRFLEIVVFYAILPLVALGLIILLFRTIRKIYVKMRLKNYQSPDLTNGFEDIKEFIRTPKAKRIRRRGPRNEHRLRRLFRETVTQHIKKGVPIQKSDTPLEMADRILSEDISELTEAYEAVRYK